MSNWIEYQVDALASSPEEIHRITEQLVKPSFKLIERVRKLTDSGEDVTGFLKELLSFEEVRRLGYVADSVNKARRFSLPVKSKYTGIVDSHLAEVSESFPNVVLLIEYSDSCASYSGKRVLWRGEVVQDVFDSNQQAQGLDWVLPDIFAPFRAEHDRGLEFGSLWNQWVHDLLIEATNLANP